MIVITQAHPPSKTLFWCWIVFEEPVLSRGNQLLSMGQGMLDAYLNGSPPLIHWFPQFMVVSKCETDEKPCVSVVHGMCTMFHPQNIYIQHICIYMYKYVYRRIHIHIYIYTLYLYIIYIYIHYIIYIYIYHIIYYILYYILYYIIYVYIYIFMQMISLHSYTAWTACVDNLLVGIHIQVAEDDPRHGNWDDPWLPFQTSLSNEHWPHLICLEHGDLLWSLWYILIYSHVHMYKCIYKYVYIYIYVRIYIYIHMYIYIYTHTYVYIYICIYILWFISMYYIYVFHIVRWLYFMCQQLHVPLPMPPATFGHNTTIVYCVMIPQASLVVDPWSFISWEW